MSTESAGRFSGKSALVTGAGKGIGHAIATALVESGAKVIGIDHNWDHECDFIRRGGQAINRDLAKVEPEALAEELLPGGPIELIVNNVGVTTPHTFMELSTSDFDHVMSVNLRTPWFLTKRLVAELRAERRSGSILFLSSLHSETPRIYPHYSASKAAVAMLTRELAHELAPDIRVNSISPGWIDSTSPPRQSDYTERFEQLIPMTRRGRPEDLVPIALDLLDEATSAYITGADVRIDGGLGLHTWFDDIGTGS